MLVSTWTNVATSSAPGRPARRPRGHASSMPPRPRSTGGRSTPCGSTTSPGGRVSRARRSTSCSGIAAGCSSRSHSGCARSPGSTGSSRPRRTPTPGRHSAWPSASPRGCSPSGQSSPGRCSRSRASTPMPSRPSPPSRTGAARACSRSRGGSRRRGAAGRGHRRGGGRPPVGRDELPRLRRAVPCPRPAGGRRRGPPRRARRAGRVPGRGRPATRDAAGRSAAARRG